jgi:hypothetical protein
MKKPYKTPKIRKSRVFIKKILNYFKPKPKKLSLEEMVEKINKENHFENFDDNLISEIYTHFSEYGNVKVEKASEYKYYITIYQSDKDSEEFSTDFIVTEDGLKLVEI